MFRNKVNNYKRAIIKRAIVENEGFVTKAAVSLGLGRTSLILLINSLGMNGFVREVRMERMKKARGWNNERI